MSSANKRRIYTKEFKQDAVNLSKSPGYTVVLAAKNLGIPEGLLYKWRMAADKSGPLAFPGNGKVALSDSEKRIRELEKQLRDSELEKEILKKAVGIFSRVPQ
jgi:transposase-like protein